MKIRLFSYLRILGFGSFVALQIGWSAVIVYLFWGLFT